MATDPGMLQTTVHNDNIGGHLASALMLLEIALDDHAKGVDENKLCDLVAAAHSFAQAARSAYINRNRDCVQPSEHAMEIVAGFCAQRVIEDAKGG